jgi:hypothetical protein
VDTTHAITSILRYMNKQDEVGVRRGGWLHSQYAYIYDFHVSTVGDQGSGAAQLWLCPNAVDPVVDVEG